MGLLKVCVQCLKWSPPGGGHGLIEHVERDVPLGQFGIERLLLGCVDLAKSVDTTRLGADPAGVFQVDQAIVLPSIAANRDGDGVNRVNQLVVQPLEWASPVFGPVFHGRIEAVVPIADHQLPRQPQAVAEAWKAVALHAGFRQPEGELQVLGTLAEHAGGKIFHQPPIGGFSLLLLPLSGFQSVIGPPSFLDPVPFRSPAQIRPCRLIGRDWIEEVVSVQRCRRHGLTFPLWTITPPLLVPRSISSPRYRQQCRLASAWYRSIRWLRKSG